MHRRRATGGHGRKVMFQVKPETPGSGVSSAQLVPLSSPVSGWHCAHHSSQASSDLIWSQSAPSERTGNKDGRNRERQETGIQKARNTMEKTLFDFVIFIHLMNIS